MTLLISYPFRLAPNGTVAVREDGDPDYYTEELACLILTQPGERVLVPEYGVEDPTYDDIDDEELRAKVVLFGPPVSITDVYVEDVYDGLVDIEIHFEPLAIGATDDPDIDDEEGFNFLGMEEDLDTFVEV